MIITDDPDVMESVRTDVCARLAETSGDGGCSSGGPGAALWLVILALLALPRRVS
jgi:MYXO-CTERM domain-containing protein